MNVTGGVFVFQQGNASAYRAHNTVELLCRETPDPAHCSWHVASQQSWPKVSDLLCLNLTLLHSITTGCFQSHPLFGETMYLRSRKALTFSGVLQGFFYTPSGGLTSPTFLRTPRPIWVGIPPWGSCLKLTYRHAVFQTFQGWYTTPRTPVKKSEKSGVPNFATSTTFVGYLLKMLDYLRNVLFRPIWENSLAHLWLLFIIQLVQINTKQDTTHEVLWLFYSAYGILNPG